MGGSDSLKKEGRRIKSLQPMNVAAVYFMPTRNGASNKFSCSIDITKTNEYIHQKRLEGNKGLGIMHIMLAAYVQTVAKYPGINRYIRGQKVYSRNSIDMCLTIKKELSLNADETVIKISAAPDDTLFDIYSSTEEAVKLNRLRDNENGVDRISAILKFIPGLVLKTAVWSLKVMDYFGLLPHVLVNASPFHGSMFITNMGSLGIPPVYHHLYDFGNIPIFFSVGMKRTENVLNSDGSVEKRKYVDITVVCDERICDGHYYAAAFKLLKRYMENAWLLEKPPAVVNRDID